MTRKSCLLMCGLALAAITVVALPAASGTGAPRRDLPTVQVNRAAKGDRLAEPLSVIVKKPMPAPGQKAPVEQTDKRELMDGCESAFSPVTMPSMAHIAGRCIG
jgi:hypothetical protein